MYRIPKMKNNPPYKIIYYDTESIYNTEYVHEESEVAYDAVSMEQRGNNGKGEYRQSL